MTGRIEKTVFISYRRTNFPWALAVYQDLTHHGYDVFFDYQSIDSGNFESVILENIKARAHFIVVLTPSALDRCNEPNDWLRREIEIAMDEKRNIIPLMVEGFDLGVLLVKEALTGKLATLTSYNGLKVYSAYFFEAMDKLRERYLNVALRDIALPALNIETKQITELQKTAANKAAQVATRELIEQEMFELEFRLKEIDQTTETLSPKEMEVINKETIDPEKRIASDSSARYTEWGTSLYNQKRYYEAEAAFRKAIKLNSGFASAFNGLGNSLRHLERYEEAEAAYSKAIELNPSHSFNAYHNFGLLLQNLKRYEEAEAAYSKAIELNPSAAITYRVLGTMLYDLKRFDEAEIAYRKAIELNPSEAAAYQNLVALLRLHDRIQDAVPLLEKIIETSPESFNSYLLVLSINKQLGKNVSPEHLAKARQFLSTNDWYNLACIESICDNFNLAFEYLKKASQLKSFNPAQAWEDPDLQWIKDEPRFKEIVGAKPD